MIDAPPLRIRVRWYERPDATSDAPGRWLRAAEAHLPEAVPRRFDDAEPLRQRFTDASAFAAAWAAADGFLFLQPSRPVEHAALASANRGPYMGPMSSHTLLAGLPVDDPRLRAFALAFADERTVLVTISSEREATTDSAGVGEPYLAPLGHWLGLPPQPPAWCWFGTVYRKALRRLPLEPAGAGGVWSGGPWVPEAFRAHPDEADFPRKRAAKVPRRLRD